MTKAKKNLILRYAVRAEELFHEHSETCEKIEAIIGEASKVEILDVLYQPGSSRKMNMQIISTDTWKPSGQATLKIIFQT